MTNQINNIIERAARLIISGEATPNNALKMALELDTEKTLKCYEDIKARRRGYINDLNINQKGFEIVLNRVYKKLSNQ